MVNVKDEVLKRAVIAGASAALKIKRKSPVYSEEDVLEEVIRNSKEIVREIDRD